MAMFTKYVDILKVFTKKHKHQLLLAGGITGTVATGLTGVRSGMRLERKLRALEDEKGEPLTRKEVAKAAFPELAPVIFAGASSIGCQAGLYISTAKRINGLTATIGALSTQIDNIKKAEKEVVGEEKAEEIQNKVVDNKNRNSLRPDKEEVKSTNGYFWFKVEDCGGAEFYARREDVVRAEGLIKSDLAWEDCAVNQFLMYIDKLACNNFYQNCGDYFGWKCGSKFSVDIDHYTTFLNDGTPAIKVVFRPEANILPKRLND